MTQDASKIEARIKELGQGLLQSVSKEVAALPGELYDSENIYAVASGLVESNTWLITVTDKRILLTYQGMMGKQQKLEMPLSQVKSVSSSSGMLLGELRIDTGGESKKIKSVPKKLAQDVASAVSELLNASKASSTLGAMGEDALERLERISTLHEKGVLTDDEFLTQKMALLGGTTPTQSTPSASTAPISPSEPVKKNGLKTALQGVLGLFFLIMVLTFFFGGSSSDKSKTPSTTQNTETVRPAEIKPAEIKQDKEFSLSRQAVISAYDDVMYQIGQVRPLAAAKEEKGNSKYLDMYSYMLTPNAAVMLQCNKEGSNPTHVKAVGVEDGTAETRALIVLNAMTLMSAVTPGWSGDERGAVAKEIGIITTFPASGDSKTLSRGGLDFTFANNGEYGLTLTINPGQ